MLASLFFLGGVNKILNYSSYLNVMTDAGLKPATVLLPLTILFEIGGSLAIIFIKSKRQIAAIVLAIFTLATNVFLHRFWELEPPVRQLELSLFFKNISIAGGLIILAAMSVSQREESV